MGEARSDVPVCSVVQGCARSAVPCAASHRDVQGAVCPHVSLAVCRVPLGCPTPSPLPNPTHCRLSAPPCLPKLQPEGRNSNKRKKLGRSSSSKKQMKSHHLSPVVSGTDNIFQSVIAVNCTFPPVPVSSS